MYHFLNFVAIVHCLLNFGAVREIRASRWNRNDFSRILFEGNGLSESESSRFTPKNVYEITPNREGAQKWYEIEIPATFTHDTHTVADEDAARGYTWTSVDSSELSEEELWAIADYRKSIDDWLSKYNRILYVMDHLSAVLAWELSTNISEATQHAAQQFGVSRSRVTNAWCSKVETVVTEVLHDSTQRELFLMCRGPKFTPSQTRRLLSVLASLNRIYNTARVCVAGRCYSGEPDLARLMQQSRDPDELLWAWRSWRQAVGPVSRPLYISLVDLMNTGARASGYSDIGESWREKLEIPHLESVVDQLYEEIRPLYQLLHAYVRHKLVKIYGEKTVSRTGPIPAHLLGNMWSQNWVALLDLLLPAGEPAQQDITGVLREHNYTVKGMFCKAEEFFTSLGLEPMTATFWEKSQLEKPKDGRNVSCHGAAANMFNGDDYRILMCADVTEEDFYTVHHEMGHVEYYMAYSHQPALFQDGANSAFHEAVGDSIMYGVMTPQHLARLELTRGNSVSQMSDVVFLLRQALSKLPLFPFSLLVDKWRWQVFSGAISPQNYNSAWWNLRRKYQGVESPVPRTEKDFDAASKFHVPDNTPYIRYFLSSLLQVQFYKGMCEAANGSPVPNPLHHCDLYGSREAGDRLRAMLSLGKSKPWPDALQMLTGNRQISAAPLLQYYQPLYQWLMKEIEENKIIIGWDL